MSSYPVWLVLMFTPLLVSGDYGSTRVDDVLSIEPHSSGEGVLEYLPFIPSLMVMVFIGGLVCGSYNDY